MTKRERRLAIALQTANSWSSDQEGKGLAMLSLGTSRRLHSQQHRENALKEIEADIHWLKTYTGECDPESDARDIDALESLRAFVRTMPIGQEWLSDRDNMRFNELLYQAGELTTDQCNWRRI